MRRYLTFLVLFGALLVGSCGGGSDNSSSDNGSDAASSESADDKDNGDDEFSGKGSGDFCARAKVLSEDDSMEMGSGDSKEEQQRKAKESLDALEGLADEAPDEIRDDIDLLVEGLRPIMQAIADGKDLASLSEEEQKQFEAISSEEYEAAGNRVNSYIEKVCKIDSDEDGDTDGVDNSADSTGDTTEDTTEDTTADE